MKTLHNNYNYTIINKRKVSKYSMFFHSTSNPLHEQALGNLCRVCGNNLHKARVSFKCADYVPELIQTFSIDVSTENPKIHPTLFCHACYMVTKREQKADQEKKPFLRSTEVFQWNLHSEGSCSVCTQLVSVRKGGRPRKQTKNRGRPNVTGHCGQYTLIDHINKCSSPPFYNRPDTLEFHSCPPSIQLSVTDIHCVICTNILNRPVSLSCACVLVCSTCLTQWIQILKSNRCPVCYINHDLNSLYINPTT